MMDRAYLTIDVERRGYGRRYTWLPVDTRDRDGCVIDLTNAYMRPEQYDLRVDDIVRWIEGERLVEAQIAEVIRGENRIELRFAHAHLLDPEAFYP